MRERSSENDGNPAKIEADESCRFCMKTSNFTGGQIAFALRQAEFETPGRRGVP
ncbi:hypothetical protein ACFSTD_17100 [Novosphingobium colocasiae]